MSTYKRMAELHAQVRELLDSGAFEVPTLPAVATQVLAMVEDEESNAAQLAALICKDQALATHLLRLANSPAFCGVTRIVSLQQAITRLGMRTIAELVVTICMQGSVFSGRAYRGLIEELWAHALATALFAKEVARQQRHNIEAAYLCGLLHRVGMPIVLKAVTDLCPAKPQPEEEQVRAVLAELHVSAGLQAVELWGLPSQVAVAVKDSERYEQAQDHRNLAAMVHLSSALASTMLQGGGAELSELPVLEELSIYPDNLSDLRQHEERISAAVAA